MKVLCALGARDRAALIERLLAHLGNQPLELMLVFVIDEGPRHGLEALRGPFGRGPHLDPARRLQMEQAEARSGEVVLAEAQAAVVGADAVTVTTHLMRGRPERVIVEIATQDVDLVVSGHAKGSRSCRPAPSRSGTSPAMCWITRHAMSSWYGVERGR
jgi:nucleotide-binding universal stress UspA family protein